MASHKMTKDLPVFVVIPCLNEEKYLLRTCQSLGFGIGSEYTPHNTHLIIVDNNSTDDTLIVAHDVLKASSPGSVLIGNEVERGYIPPRCKGNLIAKEVCNTLGYDVSQAVILQADADTNYSENYINEMRLVIHNKGNSILIEALVNYPGHFIEEYPKFVDRCNEFDTELSNLFVDDYDLIVDDKACGYSLLDYFKHGGHQREFSESGEEIHAETTRFYMRFNASGGKRVLVENAFIEHSVRKLLKNPLVEIATAGFPREQSWYSRWQNRLNTPDSINKICDNFNHQNFRLAMRIRKRHMIGLFSILPIHYARALGIKGEMLTNAFINSLVSQLPVRMIQDVETYPSKLLMDVFNLIDNYDQQLKLDG